MRLQAGVSRSLAAGKAQAGAPPPRAAFSTLVLAVFGPAGFASMQVRSYDRMVKTSIAAAPMTNVHKTSRLSRTSQPPPRPRNIFRNVMATSRNRMLTAF